MPASGHVLFEDGVRSGSVFGNAKSHTQVTSVVKSHLLCQLCEGVLFLFGGFVASLPSFHEGFRPTKTTTRITTTARIYQAITNILNTSREKEHWDANRSVVNEIK